MPRSGNRNQEKKASRSIGRRRSLDVASSFVSSTEDTAWERMSLIEYVHAHRKPFRAVEPVINSSETHLKRVRFANLGANGILDERIGGLFLNIDRELRIY